MIEAQNAGNNYPADVVTVKGTFLKGKAIFRYFISKWLIILLFGIIGAAIGLYVASTTQATYTATLNFVLSTGSKNSSISSLSSQLGLDIGGAQNNDVFSGDNIMVLFKSKKMISQVLFKKPPGYSETLVNMLVRDLRWDRQWKLKARTKDLFPFPDNGELTPVQDSLLRTVYNFIVAKELDVRRTDSKLSIYTVTTTSTDEVFSCYLTRYLMDATADFYIGTKTGTAKETLQLLQREADSLKSVLNNTIVSTGTQTDRTFALNPAMQVQRAPAQSGQVKTTVLAAAYTEIVKNLELAKINLQKESPLYQIIDAPELPLVMIKMGRLKTMIIGGIFGGLFGLVFLTLYKVMKSLNS